MASSNFYTGKMKTTTDTSVSTSTTIKPKKKTTSKKKKAIKEDEKSTNGNADENQDEDTEAEGAEGSDETNDDQGKDTSSEENAEVKSIGDIIKSTNLESSTKLVSTEPSGLSDDLDDMDKILVTLKNDNGSLKYYLWLKHGVTPPKTEEVLKDVVRAVTKASGIDDLASFRSEFGFENADETRATTAYDKYKRAVETVTKMFPGDMLDMLKEFTGTSVSESGDITCEVKPEDDDKFGVYDENGLWLASFQTKEMAEEFSKQYPSLYKKYVES